MKARAVSVLAAVALLVGAPWAGAAVLTEVADALDSDGFYVEPGAEAVDTDALADVVREARRPFWAVVLADSPPGGEAAFADDLVNDLPGAVTVIVVTPTAVEANSTEANDAEIDDAFLAAEGDLDFSSASALEIISVFSRAFDSLEAADGGEADGGGGADGTSGLRLVPILLVGGVGVAGVAALVSRRRARGEQEAQQQRALEEARAEVRGQVQVMADQILALTDRVELAGNEEASTLFTEATATYAKAQAELERSTSTTALERVSDDLDHARWQLESVIALIEGRTPPPEPERAPACFFDPTHGAGVEEVTIETAAGDKTVRVCRADAEKLRAGETPEPRMVEVGGRHVPAAMAPRSYGGGGWLGRLENFVVVLGGQRRPYGWGGYGGYGPFGAPRRRGWGGGGWSGGGGGYPDDDRDRGGYRRIGGGWFGGGGARRRSSAGRSRGGTFGRSSSSGSGAAPAAGAAAAADRRPAEQDRRGRRFSLRPQVRASWSAANGTGPSGPARTVRRSQPARC